MTSATHDFSGIVSTAHQHEAIYLPLEALAAHVFIADVSARVILSQTYSHHGLNILTETYYVFPVPARAAVCNFQFQTDSGMKLKGVVKEVSQAKEEYQAALSEQRLTGLMEQFRQDVFVVSMGAIPPTTNVTVTLSYVLDLSEDDEANTVRFQLSSHVGARYGAPPRSILYHGTAHPARLSINVEIEMPGSILDVTSLNHSIQHVQVIPGAASAGHFTCVQFFSDDVSLHKDFLLVVRARGLNKPRCFIEDLSYSENCSHSRNGPTSALALTIVPRFNQIVLPAQEYIFLIDRSGSMSGGNITMAKQALGLLLRCLPSANTTFNIFSFGSTYSSLWSQSQNYCNNTISEAMVHIDYMAADMGGTELLHPLLGIFNIKSDTTPTSVFVLTDGQVFDYQQVIDCVRWAVSSASTPLRVFTLGVGDGASTELCEGIAEAGNGACTMTLEGEDLMRKSVQLINAMQVPNVEALSVDWGVSGEVQQAPYQLQALSPDRRLLVTAILPREQTPTAVTLKGRLSDGRSLEYQVPVQPTSNRHASKASDVLGGSMVLPPLLHSLAAHRRILELERTMSQPPELSVTNCIVELGIRYQIASSCTAFVAVAAPEASTGVNLPASKNATQATPLTDGKTKDGGADTEQSPGSKASHKSPGGRSSGASQVTGTLPKTSAPRGRHGSKSASKSVSTTQSPKDNAGIPHEERKSFPYSNAETPQMPGGFEVPRQSRSSEAGHASRSVSARSTSTTSWIPAMPGEFLSKTQPSNSRSPLSTGGKPKTAQSSGPSESHENTTTVQLAPFFAQKPPLQPAEEILYVPNPLGENHPPIICTAPSLAQDTIITSFLTSLWSRMFRKARTPEPYPSGGGKGNSVFPVKRDVIATRRLAAIARLQSAEGAFSDLLQLCSIPGMPDYSTLHAAAAGCVVEDEEGVWVTAIAVAFLRKEFAEHIDTWENLEEKAVAFGAGMCGSRDSFEEIVQRAVRLF